MDTTNVAFIADPETNSVSTSEPDLNRADAPYFDLYVAMQKSARHRRLDDALAHLVTDRATAFAALTPREQAAIAWVEAVISSGKTQSSDGAYQALRKHFDETAIAKLTALAGTASARAKLGAARGTKPN
jgi:alkylhydroperoxidase family enzyme